MKLWLCVGWALWIGGALTRMILGEFGWLDVGLYAVMVVFTEVSIELRNRD